MGRKASFRDTTQIDRPRTIHSKHPYGMNGGSNHRREDGFLPQAQKCFSDQYDYRFSSNGGSLSVRESSYSLHHSQKVFKSKLL